MLKWRLLWHGWPKGLATIAILLLLTRLIGHTRPIEHASRVMWDAIESALTPDSPPRPDVLLVTISAPDYQFLFRNASPLDGDALAQLLAKIMASSPKRIFVDLDTADSKFAHLPLRIAYSLRCLRQGCPTGAYRREADSLCSASEAAPYSPVALAVELAEVSELVVWAQGIRIGNSGESEGLLPVLGALAHAKGGVVALQADSDGRVRELPEDLPHPPLPFWELAARDLGPETHADAVSHRHARPRLLPLLRPGVIPEISAGEFLVKGAGNLSKKVVFLGGQYSAADRFYMADGLMHAGVTVLAAAAIATAQNDFVKEFDGLEWSVKLALALCVWYGNHHFHNPWVKLAFVFGLLGLTCVVAVALAFQFGSILSLGGLLFAILLEQSVEGTVEHGQH